MSWISKNLTLDLLAIAIDGLTKSFDRIKSEPESEWPPAEVSTAAQQAVEPTAPVEQPQPEPTPEPQPAAPDPAQAPQAPQAPQSMAQAMTGTIHDINQSMRENPAIEQHPKYAEAQTHLRDINLALSQEGIAWITGTLFPSFGTQSLQEIPFKHFDDLIGKAVAFKLEKGLG